MFRVSSEVKLDHTHSLSLFFYYLTNISTHSSVGSIPHAAFEVDDVSGSR